MNGLLQRQRYENQARSTCCTTTRVEDSKRVIRKRVIGCPLTCSRQLATFRRRLITGGRSSWDCDYGRWDKKPLVSKITAKEICMTIIQLQMERLWSNL